MSENEKDSTCPQCSSPHGYPMGGELMACPECGHEWNPKDEQVQAEAAEESGVKDAHGTPLNDGDDIIVIKDLPVKGAAKSIKAGTKVKNIRLVDGDHDIDCKIPGFGPMALKSEFVRKA